MHRCADRTPLPAHRKSGVGTGIELMENLGGSLSTPSPGALA